MIFYQFGPQSISARRAHNAHKFENQKMALVPASIPQSLPWLEAAKLAAEHREEIGDFFKASAKKFTQSRKKRKSPTKNASRVGKPPSARGQAKAFTPMDTNPVQLSTRTFYENELTDVPKDSGFNEIDARQRESCYIEGFKILTSLENTSTKPIHFNMAVLMNRTSPAASPSPNEFFRGTGINRGLDFSTALNSNDFRARPINTDKNVVLMHKRVTLSPAGSTSYESGWKPSFHTMDAYIPIKRILTYDQGVCNNRVYIVYWCDLFNTAAAATGTATSLTHSQRVITYFKEPKVNY